MDAQRLVALWWHGLLHPDEAAQLILAPAGAPRFFRWLAAAVAVLYALYGVSMGLFAGPFPALVSALKLSALFALTLAICFPAFYVANCIAGPRFTARACLRLLMFAVSANALALCSYAPLSYFFTLTTSAGGYAFLVFMHVVVFALSAVISLAVIRAIFRAAAARAGRRIRPALVWLWGVLYGLVGSQVAWLLRPWIGWDGLAYAPLRPIQESFFESLARVIRLVFQS